MTRRSPDLPGAVRAGLVIGRFDLDGRVFDSEPGMEQATCTIQYAVGVRAGLEDDVG